MSPRRPRIRPKIYALYKLQQKGFLRDVGWFRSFQNLECVDAQGRVLPWLTYGFIHFLEPRLRRDMTVFEYGSGSSTVWWAERVREVVSCEHDPEWYEYIRPQLPSNVDFRHVPLEDSDAYCREIAREGRKYDLVSIDGRRRAKCAMHAINALEEHGVIIWDDSQRERYREGIAALKELGFRQIEFYGLSPISVGAKSTAVFYRPENVLAI